MGLPEGFRVRVAAPCKAAWSEMEGGDRVRFCRHCQRSVFNLSALSVPEAAALVQDVEQRPCVTYFERPDGTVLTADCPVGVSAARRRLAAWVTAGTALVAGLFVGGLAPHDTPRGRLLGRLLLAPGTALEANGGLAGVLSALWTGKGPSLDAPPKGLSVHRGRPVRLPLERAAPADDGHVP